VVLLEGLQSAQFEFLGYDPTGEISSWSSSWEDTAILPLAVRLDIDMPEGNQVAWPSLMTGVRVDEMAINQSADIQDYREAVRDMIRGNRPGENE
jgi:hypothetical protein